MTRRILLTVSLTTAAAVIAAALLATPALQAQAGSRERTLFVSAVNDKGEPVEGLGPGDFVVREDGQRREVLRVSHATEPIDIALLVDNSAAAQSAITTIRDGLKAFVAKMAPGNAIAIIALADRPTVYVDYTSDPKRLQDAIGRLFSMSSSGMTLLDGIVETAQGLQKRETPRAVIVPIVTDGQEFTNRYYKDVVASVTRAGAALHALAIGMFPVGTDTVSRERSLVLDAGTRDTGGQRITLFTESAVPQALQKLAHELSAQYKVVYGRPESLVPPQKIEVTSGRKGVTMRGTPPRGQTGA